MFRLKPLGLIPLLCAAGSAADRGSVQIRLTTPVSTYAPAGTEFRAKVIGTLTADVPLLPRGTVIRGAVRAVRPVGLGLRRERASLDLDFLACETPGGAGIPCSVKLLAVDNGRETVEAGNRVKGILAAGHPHTWLNGVWYRPAPGFVRRAAMGLTGTAGVIQSRLAPTPAGAGLVLASKLAFMRMPEPEVVLPAGTELIVEMETTGGAAGREIAAVALEWRDLQLARLPGAVARKNGMPVADIIHLAFTGPEELVPTAFEAAGWLPAEPRTARAVARTYNAFVRMDSHPTAPVSPLYYRGRLPDAVFQKTLNSVAKRHHIRLWREQTGDGPLYLAAATHDIGIGFRWTRLRTTHKVDPEVDRERAKVVNDLVEAGCVASVEAVERPDLAQPDRIDERATTDGRLFVVGLKECTPEDPAAEPEAAPRRRPLTRSARRLILETRHYFVRASVFYQGVRGVQSAVLYLERTKKR